MVNLLSFYARFFDFAVIYTDKQSEFAKMEVKNLIYKIGIVIWSMILFVACSNDSSDDDKNYVRKEFKEYLNT